MVLTVFAGLCAMIWRGKVPAEYLQTFMEIVMPTWLVAHAGEQGARALADARRVSGSSLPPPAPPTG